MEECVKEIEANLPPLTHGETAYSVSAAEAALPFLRNCIRENFRVTPVFTMPLARRVMNSTGVIIDGQHIPQGVSHLIDYNFHADYNANEYAIIADINRCLQPCIPSQS